ncbi:MAG: oxidoreductase [Rickettsiales bacterium]|jgi:uncharacterized protein (DUF934 family)|nr:oxidoreductase [Rickettsiales bacterium]RPG13393.1 MAG: DUF934 domain-containing protein [Pelagibacteraceae bacterium TMED195]|tara:strand:+ start:2045 stop:2494 length:450 start_codon:yes stop_codon:yes gene_type:complete
MIILNKDKPQKNEYIFLDELEQIKSLNKKKVILTKNLWIEKKQILKEKKINVGIQINSDESLDEITEDLQYFSLIQFNFLTFRDGRPFSIAKILRKKLNFEKEIRASGHILPDQYIFLIRCGFDTVEIEEKNMDVWTRFFKMDEGLYYQ